MIDASVFVGICETICIPVQGRFTLDPASDPDNPDDAALVAAAREALPDPEQPGFRRDNAAGGRQGAYCRSDLSG